MRPSCRPLLLGLLLLGACAQEGGRSVPAGSTPVQPRAIGGAETVVQLPQAAALQRAAKVLQAKGFTLDALTTPGRPIEAGSTESTSPDWATCPKITVRDEFSEAFRSRRVDASDFETRVTVVAVPVSPGETRLVFRTLHIGNYVNSFTNTVQQSSCRSTGVLEQQLVEAVRAAP